jgi:hypothetical protein
VLFWSSVLFGMSQARHCEASPHCYNELMHHADDNPGPGGYMNARFENAA